MTAPTRPTWIRWPDGRPRIAFGGDYNPEQWDRATWVEDVALMRAAGVSLVNVAIFGWAFLEPVPGSYEFGLYDEVLDLLHAGGIAVDLATGTASPPAWLVAAHPEMRPVTAEGVVLGFGARQSWCTSSPAYREASLRLTRAVAEHFADHPALALWHVSNELGCHNAHCYCDTCGVAFRAWLQDRYQDLDALNHAWGTAFWSQRYSAWSQIETPRIAPASPNPAQVLDFRRFASSQHLGQLKAERDVLRHLTPDVPITTNFMVMGPSNALDYGRFAPEIDLVSNDHYLREGDAEPHVELALSADVVRGLAEGQPWLLMESATGAVNWGSINEPKGPGVLRRHALSHVARGADGIGYFQWRQSRSGAEKYHSAMLPHAGPDTRVHREVVALGADLQRLEQLVGSQVDARVGIVYDWEAWWAAEGECHPSTRFSYRGAVESMYRPLWRSGFTCDVVLARGLADTDLSRYRLLVLPALHVLDPLLTPHLEKWVADGGILLVTWFSSVVDPDDRIFEGGAPGPLRHLLGVDVEEVWPLRPGDTVQVERGLVAETWTEHLRVRDADAIARFSSGALDGQAALTRRAHGRGAAWYLAAQLDERSMDGLVLRLTREAGIVPAALTSRGVEAVRRRHSDGTSFLIAINHTESPGSVHTSGHDLLSGRRLDGHTMLDPGEVVVVREEGPGRRDSARILEASRNAARP